METSRSLKTGKLAAGFFAFVAVFAFQVFAGKLGWAAADLFTYETVDPDNLFGRLSVHHFTLMLIGLAVILIIRMALRLDFGFHLGDKKVGMRYLLYFSGVMAVIALAYHFLLEATGQPVSYAYSLTGQNVLGSLGFQLLLSGPAEEILYRALPVTLLVTVLGKSIPATQDISLEVVLAALLFTAAHINWTSPSFSITDVNLFALAYAFGMGILNGFVYQKSRSIVYPILMHSVSNVLMVGTGYLFAILF